MMQREFIIEPQGTKEIDTLEFATPTKFYLHDVKCALASDAGVKALRCVQNKGTSYRCNIKKRIGVNAFECLEVGGEHKEILLSEEILSPTPPSTIL